MWFEAWSFRGSPRAHLSELKKAIIDLTGKFYYHELVSVIVSQRLV